MKIDPDKKEEKLLEYLVNTTDKKVLEIGCGDGRLSFVFAKKASSFTGLDVSKKAIAKAIESTPDSLKNKIEFLATNAAKLNFPDNSFDVVVVALTLHEIRLSRQAQALREIYRLIGDDGKLYVIESLPDAEVQEIYSTAYQLKDKEDHAARINYSRSLLEAFDSAGLFKLINYKRYNIPWEFDSKEELFSLMIEEQPFLKEKSIMDKYQQEIRKKLGSKMEELPIIIYDQINFFEYQKISNKNPDDLLTRLPKIPDWIEDEHRA